MTNPVRQYLGNVLDVYGTLWSPNKGWGLSEKVAGGPTIFTGRIPEAQAAEPTPVNYTKLPTSAGSVYGSGQGAGASTGGNPPAPTGGGGGTLRDQFNAYVGSGGYAGWDLNAAWADFQAKGGNMGGGGSGGTVDQYAEQARRDIESGYSDYLSQLDMMLNQGLPSQRASQEELARLQYTGGVEALQPQLQAGQTLLTRQRERAETSQAKNLRDLAANLRNAMMAGNVFLGARGAGDSSASNMYSYALSKLSSQQRGNIMGQTADIMREIGDREVNLNNIYNAEINRLANERDQKIAQIATWFDEQQNALRQAKGQVGVARGQDLANLSQNLLNTALQQLAFVQQEASNRRTALEQWALSNADSIQEAKANLQGVSAFQPTLPQAQKIVGQPSIFSGGFNIPAYAPVGYGRREEEEKQGYY